MKMQLMISIGWKRFRVLKCQQGMTCRTRKWYRSRSSSSIWWISATLSHAMVCRIGNGERGRCQMIWSSGNLGWIRG